MPHIYGVSLAKGDIEFTPRFEHVLGDHRARVLAFFESLPFYVRTAAGVMLAHAGPAHEASPNMSRRCVTSITSAILRDADQALGAGGRSDAALPPVQRVIWRALRRRGRLLPGGPGAGRSALHALAARVYDLAAESSRSRMLWDTLFTTNEIGLTEWVYLQSCQQFLAAFSVGRTRRAARDRQRAHRHAVGRAICW